MSEKPNAPATGRNSEPILDVLRIELEKAGTVLEIGSGTGQHAVYFARRLPHLNWQTSDLAENHKGIRAWLDDSGLKNVRQPLELDILTSAKPEEKFDAVFSANTAHIMSFDAVTRMFQIVAECLGDGGKFCLYGPFKEGGEFTSSSNESFDRSLKMQESSMGIRNIEDLDDLAHSKGMKRIRVYAMPANNQIAIWSKS